MTKVSKYERLEKVLAATGGNVYWLDQDGVYQGCNDNVAKILGLKSRKEIVGLRDQDLLRYGNWTIKQANAFSADTQEVIQTKRPKYNVEEPVVYDQGGHAVYFLTTRIPIFDEEENVIGVVGTSTDITALRKAQESLVIAKQEAEAANQTKTEFLANMSHDVKTPLSGLIAASEVLALRTKNQDDKKMLEEIYRCGQRLMSFFENCIELSKMDMAELQAIEKVFSIKQLTESIYDLFVPRATQKKLLFSVHLDANLPSIIIGNQNNIYRVILNLIGNAMKFTEKGSVDLSIKLDKRVEDDLIIKVIVKDTGIGIPKEKQKIIFEKLERLTPSYYNKQEGHGIGLYIVDQYVKAMHGFIHLDSDIGQGSTFTITLPVKASKTPEPDLAKPPKLTVNEVPSAARLNSNPIRKPLPIKLPPSSPRVLLVEDNLMIQTVTKEIIHAAGAMVDVASCGQEAIDLFSPGKYCLIYMDVGLPDMDGYVVAQHLREKEVGNKAKPTPIIALSAHASEDIKTFCLNASMDGILSKPLSIQQAQDLLKHYNKAPSKVKGLTA